MGGGAGRTSRNRQSDGRERSHTRYPADRFPGLFRGASLEPISWDEFFDKFEKEKLAFLHQDGTARGKTSRFNKLIAR
jgi:hypothetical protein